MKIFVSCPKGLQYVLETELRELGLEELKPVLAGVEAIATQLQVYKILLWSRIANRVFIELASGKVKSADDLYELSASVDWGQHFDVSRTFSVSFNGKSEAINNTAFGSLKIKDGIVDRFRLDHGERPSVSKQSPDVRVSAKLSRDVVTISLDLSGESLHKRGYRLEKGAAPLRENLAAGLLRLCGWGNRQLTDETFIDPMCGSGTLCIEAALLGANIAPGLGRESWGFDVWKKHDAKLWSELVEHANKESELGRARFKGKILGYDQDAKVVGTAWQNIERANVKDLVHVEKKQLSDFEYPVGANGGLLLTNPPYGERLGELAKLEGLYRDLGTILDAQFSGWRAGVFTGNESLENHMGWKYKKRYKLLNGALESALLVIEVESQNRFKKLWFSASELTENPERWTISNEERAAMLSNRLKKNLKSLSKWRKKNDISCFRAYDADIPEFAFAVDVYESEEGEKRAYVQEYAAPKTVDEGLAAERLSEGLVVTSEVLEIGRNLVSLKQRQKQRGDEQYNKESDGGDGFVVREFGARILVNIGKYLDTGLFLDHRAVRRWVRVNSKGKKVLNLFSYTSVVSLQAALGGASSVKSVDLSQTYLRWSEKNFKLNKLVGGNYQFERADCMAWLRDRVEENGSSKYDVIFIDPPSFSNSKRLDDVFDVQRDHVELIDNAMRLLNDDGILIFSNNLKKFKFAQSLHDRFQVEDKTKFSLDRDYERSGKIHQCWFISKA